MSLLLFSGAKNPEAKILSGCCPASDVMTGMRLKCLLKRSYVSQIVADFFSEMAGKFPPATASGISRLSPFHVQWWRERLGGWSWGWWAPQLPSSPGSLQSSPMPTDQLKVQQRSQKAHLYRVPQCMPPRRNWDSPKPSLNSDCAPPPGTKGGGGHTRLRVRGWGSPNSDDWRKA